MSEKQIKEWGKIGGFQSMSQNWTLPDDSWPFWSLYEKCADYNETAFSGEDGFIISKVECFKLPVYTCDTPPCLTYYEFSLNTGQPLATLTVKQGKAKKKPEESCLRYLDWRIFK